MANTLKFGAGNWATKEGSTLAYNDLNSNFKPLPFNFSRDGLATVINKDGLIEEVGNNIPRIDFLGNTQGALKLEPQRTNLITQSEAFGNPYWTKSGASIQGDPSTAGSELITDGSFSSSTYWGGTNAAVASGVATFTGTSGQESTLFQQNIAIVTTSGTLHALTYTVVSNNLQGSAAFYAGYKTNNECIQKQFLPMTVGTHTVYANSVGTGNGFSLHTSVGFTSGSLVIDNVSVKEIQGFSAPDGTNNAYKLVGNGANSTHLLRKYIGATALTTHSFSFFVKKGEITKLGIREDAQTGNYVSFDLETKTIITQVVMTLTYEEVGDYLKIKISSVIGSNGTAGYAIYMLDDAYTGGVVDGSRVIPNGSGFYIYGAQLEVGSYATSYIPTQGSVVTRLAETCSQTVPDGVIGQTEGTIFINLSWTEIASNIYYVFNDGTSSNRILIYSTSESQIFVLIQSGGVTSASFSISGQNTRVLNKIAVSYKNNDFKVALNGIIEATDTSGNAPQGIDFIEFLLYGEIAENKLYNTALTEQELIALTQV